VSAETADAERKADEKEWVQRVMEKGDADVGRVHVPVRPGKVYARAGNEHHRAGDDEHEA